MKHSLKILVILASLASPMLAGEAYKVLPTAISNDLKSGKKLDKVWIGSEFKKDLKIKTTEVVWSADARNSTLQEELTKQIKTIEKDGVYTLKIFVVTTSTKTFTGFGYVLGKITVEGTISGADGKVVAAFQHKSKINEGMSGFDYPGTVDTIISALMKDLL